MEIDPRVRRRYELVNVDDRLWQPGLGDLVRLWTWDIFDRLLPERGCIADIGGGPGAHAVNLARAGHDVVLIDPVFAPRRVCGSALRVPTRGTLPGRRGRGASAFRSPMPAWTRRC